MTQPPDDRLPPPGRPEPADEEQPGVPPPDERTTPENAPTVAWTPPDSGEPPPEPADPATPPSPIISAEAAQPPTTGWQVPGSPPPTLPAAVSGGGWGVPATQVAFEQREGYVVGGVGGRLVAWLIDQLLAGLVPGALFLLVFDWSALFRQMFDQIKFDAAGRVIPNYAATYTFPVTLDLILALLIFVGVQYLYFVGFWTSRWHATPGMMGLKIRLVDAGSGAGLTVTQATKRWIAMGYPLILLVVVPVLQYAVSLAQLAVNLFLFFSTVSDDRKQGLHDKFAGSQVIRSVTSGDGATFVGCLVYVVMWILITIVAGLAFFVVAGPSFIEFVQRMPRYQP